MRLFEDLAREKLHLKADAGDIEMRVLIPAFMISELRRAFEIGFLIVLPFLVIDMVVATLTMSMGMMMLPPTTVSLPFKVLFFVLIDGWNSDRRIARALLHVSSEAALTSHIEFAGTKGTAWRFGR